MKCISDYYHYAIRDYQLFKAKNNTDHLDYAKASYKQYKALGGKRIIQGLEEL